VYISVVESYISRVKGITFNCEMGKARSMEAKLLGYYIYT